MKYHLYQQIGDPITLQAGKVNASDVAASDATAGVPIHAAGGILFILSAGADLAGDTIDVSLIYSSTGTASDAGLASNIGATDCAFAQLDSNTEGMTAVMDINDLGRKGWIDEAGKIFCNSEGVGDASYTLIGIPYNLKYYPATNAITVIAPST